MRLHIIARGKIARSSEAELVDRYLARIGWPSQITELPDKGGKLPAEKLIPLRKVALDEKGRQYSSTELAQLLGNWRDDGVRECRFFIGAADGLTQEERQSADLLLSLGKATWPHLLVRAMLAEQLFRATSILANHPYHRAG